ncbi:MAG: 6-phosphogluconolactonase [Phycisphaerales bacterium]|nr:6-phosphogluconolactonase [Phycisphaerales bacterium]
MQIQVLENPDAVARAAAAYIAEQARSAVAARGQFTLAVSGGRTPWAMLRRLADQDVPWESVAIFQVDERVAPAGHEDRNLNALHQCLTPVPLSPERVYAMPVEADDRDAACVEYASTLSSLAGDPPVFDLVHLGIGSDGHTASLIPDDPVLDVDDVDVALAGPYQGRRRMTLTFPILNRARQILWVVTGGDKADALALMCAGDTSIPAGRIRQDNALLLADTAVAQNLSAPDTGR